MFKIEFLGYKLNFASLCKKVPNNVIKSVFFSYFADVPIVKLQFGTILKADSIKEGDDIYFECIVEARPPATSIEWYLNVRSFPLNNTLALNLPRYMFHTCARTEVTPS